MVGIGTILKSKLNEMAEKKYFDDRNKGSVELARELDPIIAEKRFLPFI